jgi:hypothetical protein
VEDAGIIRELREYSRIIHEPCDLGCHEVGTLPIFAVYGISSLRGYLK